MEIFIIVLAVIVLVGVLIYLPVFICTRYRKEMQRKKLMWDGFDEHIQGQIMPTSKTIISTQFEPKTKNIIPEIVVSVDTNNKKIMLTSLNTEKSKEFSYLKREWALESIIFDFKSIVGGEIVLGGRSMVSNSVGLGVGYMVGVGTSTSSITDGLSYIIRLDDINNPIYKLVISKYPIREDSKTYRLYMDGLQKLDGLIKQVSKDNVK